MLKKLLKRRPKQDKQGPAAPVKPGGISILMVGGVAFLICAAVLAAAGRFSHQEFLNQLKANQQASHEATVERVAVQLAGRIQGYTDAVEVAARDPELVSALENGNSAFLQQWTSQFKSLFMEALRVRLVFPNEDQPDTSTSPPLSYACLDLVRHAESQTDSPPVEVHLFGGPDQHIDLVRPVRVAQGVIASLIVSLDVARLQDWLRPLVPAGSYVELRQGPGLLLAAQGEKGLQDGAPQHRTPVAGTAWKVAYWAAPASTVLPEASLTGFITVGGIAVGIVALVFIVMSLLLSRLLHKDLVDLLQYFVDLHKRKRIQTVSMRLAEFRKAVMVMDQQIGGGTKKEKRRERKEAQQEEGAESDIESMPEVMFMTDGGVSLKEVSGSDSEPEQEAGKAGKGGQ